MAKRCAKLVSGLGTKDESWLDFHRLARNTHDGQTDFEGWSSHSPALSKTALEHLEAAGEKGSLECARLGRIGRKLGLADFSITGHTHIFHSRPIPKPMRESLESAMMSEQSAMGYRETDVRPDLRKQMRRQAVARAPGRYPQLVEKFWIGAPALRWTPGANAAAELESATAQRMIEYCRDLADLLSSMPKARAEAQACGAPIPAWCLESYANGYTELAFKRIGALQLYISEPTEILAGVESKALFAEKVGADGVRSELGFYNKRGEFSRDPSDAALFDSSAAAMQSARHLWKKHGHCLVAVVDVSVAVVGCHSAMTPAVSHDRLASAIAEREREEMHAYAKKLDHERMAERLIVLEAENKSLKERLGIAQQDAPAPISGKRRL